MNWQIVKSYGLHQHEGEFQDFVTFLTERPIRHVIEIGMLHGGTAAVWCQIASGKVIGVDLPNGVFGGADHHLDYDRCMQRNTRLSAQFPNFTGVLGNSGEEATSKLVRDILHGDLVDLLFIDGDHTFRGVQLDYYWYRQFVRPGGVVAFHDVAPTDFHESQGVRVPEFWSSLKGTKREFLTPNQAWGGIGALIV